MDNLPVDSKSLWWKYLVPETSYDEAIALGSQLFSALAAVGFYHYAHIKSTGVWTRHYVSALIGVGLAIICYGWQSLHLLVLCSISFATSIYLPPKWKGIITFVIAVGHVLGLHLYNCVHHYMEFPVEVSNSLMILSIKVTSTAFSIGDNHRPTAELTRNQNQQRLKVPPLWAEYFCYCFCFLGLLFGPSYSFTDYISFIEGKQYKARWPLGKAMRKMGEGLISLILFALFKDVLSAHLNLRADILSSGFLFRHVVLYATMCCMKWKYYFGWLTSESICYLGGLGYDSSKTGDEEWGARIPTVRIIGVETATSLKSFLDNWNMFTAQWLHFCVYERAGAYKALLTFLLSATWHGFYPGYYFLFLPYAMGIIAGRKVRRNIRPIFQSSPVRRMVYACITWVGTAILISYHGSAFHLKELEPIIRLQKSLYFWPHLVVILALVILPVGKPSRSGLDKNSNHKSLSETENSHALQALQAG